MSTALYTFVLFRYMSAPAT